MSKKVKFPSLTRRPAGLRQSVQTAIIAQAAAAGVTAAGIATLIDPDGEDSDGEPASDDEVRAAAEWLELKTGLNASHAWWTLAKHEAEAANAAALDIEDGTHSIEEARRMLRQRFVYAARRDEVWDRQAADWISTRALSATMCHAMPVNENGVVYDAFRLLSRDPEAQRVHNERFEPGVDQEILDIDGVHYLNTWEAPDLRPRKGDAKPILDHILYLCDGRKKVAAAVLDWLAYIVQNPGKKIPYSILLISKSHGVGKDTLRLALKRIIGASNVSTLDDGAVAEGRFEFMRRAQLVCVPEIMTGDRRDIANKLKHLITQEVVRVNEKNVKPYDVPNRANFLFFSNHENAAHIEDEDRRYFVIICRGAARDGAYYDALYDYIEGDGLASFAHFLLNRDLSAFNPNSRAPDTEDKKVVQQATMGGWEAWLKDAWESEAAPFDVPVINLREALDKIVEMKGPKMTIQQLGGFLGKREGAADLDRVRMSNGKRVRLWAVRDGKLFETHPDQIVGAYERPCDFDARRMGLRVVAAE